MVGFIVPGLLIKPHIPTGVAHRYWRVNVYDNNSTGTLITSMGDIELAEGEFEPNIADQGTLVVAPPYDSTATQAPKTIDGYFGTSGGSYGNWDGVEHNTSLSTISGTWTWDFGSGNEKDIGCVRLIGGGSPLYMPSHFALQYSDDNATWLDALERTTETAWGPYQIRSYLSDTYVPPTYSGSPWGAHTYWRLQMFNGVSIFFGHFFAELEFRDSPGGAQQAVGGTATASNTYNGYVVDNLFDGTTSFWGINTNIEGIWVLYEFATPVEVGEIAITARGDAADGEKQCPGQWVLQFSDDGTTWTSTMWIYDPTVFTYGETREYADPNYL